MKFLLSIIISLFIMGCTTKTKMHTFTPVPTKFILPAIEESVYIEKEELIFLNLNETIIDMANQLFSTKFNQINEIRVILTSFVDLENFEKTSTFGRLLSESMFNELHIRNFLVTDFRGKEAVSVNEDGEFHITRDAELLKDNIESIEYILVGSYVKFENQSLLINARIMDSNSGKLLSTARVIYKPKDCKLFGVCEEVKKDNNLYDGTNDFLNTNQYIQEVNMNARDESTFNIVADDKETK